MAVVGIDLGLTGAICELDDNGKLKALLDMPTLSIGRKSRKTYNVAKLAQILAALPRGSSVIAESVHAMPLNGSVASFGLGQCLGLVQGITAALGLSLTLVTPTAWKKSYGLLKAEKSESIKAALALDSGLSPYLTRVVKGQRVPLAKSHNRAEAYLLASYFRSVKP